MSRVDLRRYEPGDDAALAVLWRASVPLMGLDGFEVPPPVFFEEKLAEMVTRCEVTVAVRAGAPVGFMALDIEAALLDQMFLAPDVLRQGIGARLFELACQRLPAGFRLYTPSANARACAFYKAVGMTVSHHDRHPVWGHPITFFRWP